MKFKIIYSKWKLLLRFNKNLCTLNAQSSKSECLHINYTSLKLPVQSD
jgi:hypothetical protein